MKILLILSLKLKIKNNNLKQSVAKPKNVDMAPRQAFGEVEAGGIKVRALGDNSNDFKFKIKNNK